MEFEGQAAEHCDLVFDARGVPDPERLHPGRHIDVSFIPTNTAIIHRCSAVINAEPDRPVPRPTYTRAVAHPMAGCS